MESDFESPLLEFGRQFVKIVSESDTYLIEFKPDFIQSKATVRVMSIVVAGKTKGYHAQLTAQMITAHKTAMGFQGTWASYFNLLKQAISGAKKGSITLAENKLQIMYPLTDTTHIKGEFLLTPSDTDVFDLLLSIFSEYQTLKEQSAHWKIEEPDTQCDTHQVGDTKKRKMNANLVNPFARKKMPIGAKIE
jgi:hypothetical protein